VEDKIARLKEIASNRPEMGAVVDGALSSVESCSSLEEVKDARVKLLGKKGSVTALFKSIGQAPPEEKPLIGEAGNLLRTVVEEKLDAKERELRSRETSERMRREALDVTLPGRRPPLGRRHLLSQVTSEITNIFISMGYQVVEGPEAELDYYNFEALNTPPMHPARSLNDTFYIRRADAERDSRDDVLLRTHTSPVQVRQMESRKPPLYVVSPGKAYRRDEIDMTHSAMFSQVEGFAVDKGINMGHLKGTLEVFAKRLFGEDRDVRFRPHFFPFTEPSAEVDVSCFVCQGSGCSLCKGVGWLEILGCGMIDPNVFDYVGIDKEEYTGFAFGMGIERVAMMKYGIDDMRVLYENDVRFLKQF